MARRTGGVPRDQAIERAQSALETAKPAYEDFLEREVAGLTDLVRTVEAGNDEPGWIETVHSAAVNCATAQVRSVTSLWHLLPAHSANCWI